MPNGTPFASDKINLNYTGAGVSIYCAGFDTVTAQYRNVSSGDMVASTLIHRVSNDGVNWVDGFFDELALVTAAGTQSDSSPPINVQGWPWYRCEVGTPASGAKWVLLSLFAKNNTTGGGA